jgi:hypothetical protein
VRAGSELPDIDDRIVEPDTRYEMLDGELVYVSSADPPHGELHVQLAVLIEAHTAGVRGHRRPADAHIASR